MPEFILDGVTKEQYEQAGSKFITFPPDAEIGDGQYREVEIGELDWDTPGKSLALPVTVSEDGPDHLKADKISFGISADAIWKGKEIYRAITGEDPPMKKGSDGKTHPAFDPMLLAGKKAVGYWQMTEGKKGGDPNAPSTKYPKLLTIVAEKPDVGSLGV